MAATHVTVNRAPVLTLWAAVVAQRLGFERAEALTLGRVVAGLNAYAKGKALGLYHPRAGTVATERKQLAPGAVLHVYLLNRAVPMLRTDEGLRAVSKDKAVTPESVQRYLESKFGALLESVEAAMMRLAEAIPDEDIAVNAYPLYEAFRPKIPSGVAGWGAAGVLDLERIHHLAATAAKRSTRSPSLLRSSRRAPCR